MSWGTESQNGENACGNRLVGYLQSAHPLKGEKTHVGNSDEHNDNLNTGRAGQQDDIAESAPLCFTVVAEAETEPVLHTWRIGAGPDGLLVPQNGCSEIDRLKQLGEQLAGQTIPRFVETPLGLAWCLVRPLTDGGWLMAGYCGEKHVPAETSLVVLNMLFTLAVGENRQVMLSSRMNATMEERNTAEIIHNLFRPALSSRHMAREIADTAVRLLALEQAWIWWRPEGTEGWVEESGEANGAEDVAQEAQLVAEMILGHGRICGQRLSSWYVGTPLPVGGMTQGALVGRFPPDHGQPDDRDMRMLSAMAIPAAGCIQTGELLARLERTTDELKKTREALRHGEKLRVLGELCTGIAHDLNNVLTSISLRSELGKGAVDDERVRGFFETINTAAVRGGQIVRRIQEYSNSSRREYVGELIDLGEVVREVLDEMWPRCCRQVEAGGQNVSLHLQIMPDLHVIMDQAMIREVLSALLQNSIEAMPEGGDITIEVLQDEENALLRVSDTGEGFSPEAGVRAFDPFFTTKGTNHVGLGLSVVHGIVQECGGQTLVTDGARKTGATVTISLPVAEPRHLGDDQTAATAVAVNGIKPLSILVVDDEEEVLEAISQTLQQGGHRVTAATGGREALSLMRRSEDFDALIIDLGMPEINGWELAGLARRMQPAAAILLLTGWGSRIAESNDGRLDEILTKPIQTRELQQSVVETVRNRKMRQRPSIQVY